MPGGSENFVDPPVKAPYNQPIVTGGSGGVRGTFFPGPPGVFRGDFLREKFAKPPRILKSGGVLGMVKIPKNPPDLDKNGLFPIFVKDSLKIVKF